MSINGEDPAIAVKKGGRCNVDHQWTAYGWRAGAGQFYKPHPLILNRFVVSTASVLLGRVLRRVRSHQLEQL
jgi:hypothetical protein